MSLNQDEARGNDEKDKLGTLRENLSYATDEARNRVEKLTDREKVAAAAVLVTAAIGSVVIAKTTGKLAWKGAKLAGRGVKATGSGTKRLVTRAKR